MKHWFTKQRTLRLLGLALGLAGGYAYYRLVLRLGKLSPHVQPLDLHPLGRRHRLAPGQRRCPGGSLRSP